MRRPTARFQYVRREPGLGEYLAMTIPMLLLAGVGYVVLLVLLGVAGAGGAAVVWLCGFLLLGGITHGRPPLALLRWGWLIAGALVVLTT